MAKRLEQLSLNFDDPTLEETEKHQKIAEAIEFDGRCSELLKKETARRYSDFLNEAKMNGVSFKAVEDASLKRDLLSKYFPVQYQRQGINKYSPEKLNRVFLGFLNYAHKVVKESKH